MTYNELEQLITSYPANIDAEAFRQAVYETRTSTVLKTVSRSVPNPDGSYELGTAYDITIDEEVGVEVTKELYNAEQKSRLLSLALDKGAKDYIAVLLKDKNININLDKCKKFIESESISGFDPIFANLEELESKARTERDDKSPTILRLSENIKKEIINFVIPDKDKGTQGLDPISFKENCSRFIKAAGNNLGEHQNFFDKHLSKIFMAINNAVIFITNNKVKLYDNSIFKTDSLQKADKLEKSLENAYLTPKQFKQALNNTESDLSKDPDEPPLPKL